MVPEPQTPPRQVLATVGIPTPPTFPKEPPVRRRLLTLSMLIASLTVAAQPAFAVVNMQP